MKSVAAGFLASLVLASNTYADPIPIYGNVDALVGAYSISANCGGLTLPKCEEAKIEFFSGGNTGSYDLDQVQTNEGAGWFTVNDSDPNTDLVAFNLSAFSYPVTYYAIKTGSGNATNDLFVFRNDASVQYALIDLNVLEGWADRSLSAGTISHIAAVPEPGLLLLLGIGLTATAVQRRLWSRQGQVVPRP